jgi:OmcA/MtrC family decaheme c-type cytochrome
MKKAVAVLLIVVAALVLTTLAAAASTGSSTANAPPAQGAPPVPTVETCTICHKNQGTTHQAKYNELFQDEVIEVSDVKYSFTPNPDTTAISFKLTKNGQPFDPSEADALNIYWAPYTDGKFQFEPAAERLSLKGKVTSDGKGTVTSTLVEKAKDAQDFVDYTDVSKSNGIIVIYGRDETLGRIRAAVDQNKYPFAGLQKTGAVDYTSTANVAGCVKCHTDPYLKHGYIYGTVGGDPKTDFQTCKACHLDNGPGGHFEWQLLVDNPELAVKFLAEPDEEKAVELLSADQKKMYAYTTTVMNDVHMSHAMEFPYPQSMANCVACHEGKLDKILVDANFTAATCKSCHPVTGAVAKVAKEGDTPAYDTTTLALKTIMGEKHPPMDLSTNTDCSACHKTGGVAAALNKIHTGYDTTISNAAGLKYSDAVSMTIQSATLNGNKLNVKFNAAAKPGFKDIDVTKGITPTVVVGLYGWDTKDFIIGGHERLIDDNKDGKLDNTDQRNLEAEFGAETPNPRLAITSAKGGEWEAVADLSAWANLIKDGTVKRLEVGVLPAAVNTNEEAVAVDATTRTFDLKTGKFDDQAFAPIADAQKCESCHGALATTFHQPAYGGSILRVACAHHEERRSHLEMQSRSIDSYAHAIHSFQPFDVADINFRTRTRR